MWTRTRPIRPLPPPPALFGIRGPGQLRRDLEQVVTRALRRTGFDVGPSTVRFFRPDLSLPAYLGLLRRDGLSPIYNFFDRVTGGREYRNRVTATTARDWRGGRLTYDDHDGTDFVCPPGTPLVAAAPGRVVAVRERWLRGGLTVIVDHGEGVLTQYTHCTEALVEVGAPVERGEIIASSGVSGLDLLSGFPFVPPHVHFMVWVDGRPVDPYLAEGERPRAGVWWPDGRPRIVAGALEGDPEPPSDDELKVDVEAVERALARCRDPRIARELEDAPSDAARAAILEDSVHHESWAWPAGARSWSFRGQTTPERVRITVPLPARLFRDVVALDLLWTRPPAS